MAQGLTLNELTATTFTNQNDLLLIYQTGSTLSISVGNLTKNNVFGSGTLNYIPKWSGTTGITNSTILDNGSVVWVGYNNLLTSFRASANTFNIGKGGSGTSRALFMGKSIPSTWTGSSICGQFDFNNPEGDQGVVIRTNAGYVGTGATPIAGGIISVQGNAKGLILAGNPTEENHLVIDRFGKVGVGTNIPTQRFHVSGDTLLQGILFVGNDSNTGGITNARFNNPITGPATSTSVFHAPTVGTGATNVYGIRSQTILGANTTLGFYNHFSVADGSFGAGASLNQNIGFSIGNDFRNGISNIGFYGGITSNTSNWNIYMVGDAPNYLNGNLGIGTNTPVSKLDVNVTSNIVGVRISGNSDSDMLRVTQTGSGNAIVVEDSSNPDSSPFVVKSDGSVGIGTNTPNRKLTVSGNMESTGIIFCTNVIASESLQGNEIFPSEDVDLNISTRTNSGTQDINLMTGPKPGGLGYIRMKITSGGTIGVNTESPTALFDISSPTGTTVGLRVSGNSSTDMVRITQVGTGHTFVVEDSQNPDSTPFVIRNDGKVYLGTYTEDTTSLLNVGGNAHIWGNVYFTGSANVAIQNAVPGRTLINFASVGNSYFNNGNLGVGTTSPGARLDVTPPTGSTVGLRVSGNSNTDMVRITQTGSGNALTVEGNIIYSSPSTPPVSSGSTGTKGTVTWDGNYLYICVDTNTWKRSQLLSW